jgi:hypothetical protein
LGIIRIDDLGAGNGSETGGQRSGQMV